MDKQELENRVLNPGINNNITINGKTYIRESRALYLIDHLDAPEKPEIPHRTAVKIESLRDAGKSDSTIYWNFFGDEEMVEWANDNADTLMQALVNGYTEKAPVWIVKAPYDRYFGGFLEKGQHAEINFSHINRDNAQKFEDKNKAEAVATLVDGEVEEWSEKDEQ